jgi:hypothetical protein
MSKLAINHEKYLYLLNLGLQEAERFCDDYQKIHGEIADLQASLEKILKEQARDISTLFSSDTRLAIGHTYYRNKQLAPYYSNTKLWLNQKTGKKWKMRLVGSLSGLSATDLYEALSPLSRAKRPLKKSLARLVALGQAEDQLKLAWDAIAAVANFDYPTNEDRFEPLKPAEVIDAVRAGLCDHIHSATGTQSIQENLVGRIEGIEELIAEFNGRRKPRYRSLLARWDVSPNTSLPLVRPELRIINRFNRRYQTYTTMALADYKTRSEKFANNGKLTDDVISHSRLSHEKKPLKRLAAKLEREAQKHLVTRQHCVTIHTTTTLVRNLLHDQT